MRRIILLALVGIAGGSANALDSNFDLSFGTLGLVTPGISAANGTALAVQADGKILAIVDPSSNIWLATRFDATGALDGSFGHIGRGYIQTLGGRPSAMAVQSDGAVVLAGAMGAEAAIARLNSNGNADVGFGDGGLVTTALAQLSSTFSSLVIAPNGQLIAAGTSFDGDASHMIVARYFSDGTPDPSFAGGGVTTIDLAPYAATSSVLRQPDGRLVLVGAVATNVPATSTTASAVRLDPDGALDPSFGTGGGTTIDESGFFSSAALQDDGRIVATGTAGGDVLVARFASNGQLDSTFGMGGIVRIDLGAFEEPGSVALQSNGKIVVVGSTMDGQSNPPSSAEWIVLRLDADGALDPTFGTNGRLTLPFAPFIAFGRAVIPQANARLLLAGIVYPGVLVLARVGGSCGDGTIAGLETCDDGNSVAGDCCDLACQAAPLGTPCPGSTLCAAPFCDSSAQCACCLTSAQCNDGDSCTDDICNASRQCTTTPIADCVPCSSNADCDTGCLLGFEVCFQSRCVSSADCPVVEVEDTTPQGSLGGLLVRVAVPGEVAGKGRLKAIITGRVGTLTDGETPPRRCRTGKRLGRTKASLTPGDDRNLLLRLNKKAVRCLENDPDGSLPIDVEVLVRRGKTPLASVTQNRTWVR